MVNTINNPRKINIEGAYDYVAVTPNDSTNLKSITRALYVGADGNIVVECPATGENVIFAGMAGGSIYPIETKKVLSTGTSATDIVAIF